MRPSSPFVAGFMGADNALDVVGTPTGAYAAANGGTGPRLRAHFRSDAARLAPAAEAGDGLHIAGVIAQSIYVGQGWRYRVRAGSADIWVHAAERVAEETSASVVVPREALLLFPAKSSTHDREVA
jgi:putative spermidine/putrescine transport system ATP-binding protein